ncbi:MAG: hypothetical protein M1155_03075, partial [Patescibacteria group bacterium]|nr:hypothetical protein [Patescibacteria group bacterium]
MKYTYKDLPGSIKHLDIDLSQAEFAKYWEVVREEAIKNVEIKGFRKGMAPKEMASAAIDQEKVFNEAAVRAIREILKEITDEKQWEIIDQPKINIEEKGNDLFFKVDIAVFPEVELGDYKKIAAKIFSEKIETSASDEEVNEAINWILNSRAKIVRSTAAAKMGDVVNVTYKGKDDQFILGHSHIDEGAHEHSADDNSHEMGHDHKHVESEFDKKIVGHKEGDEFDGVKLTGIFERQIPEMTDALAQELGKFKTVDELKASIKDGIQKEKEIKEKEKLRIRVLEEMV